MNFCPVPSKTDLDPRLMRHSSTNSHYRKFCSPGLQLPGTEQQGQHTELVEWSGGNLSQIQSTLRDSTAHECVAAAGTAAVQQNPEPERKPKTNAQAETGAAAETGAEAEAEAKSIPNTRPCNSRLGLGLTLTKYKASPNPCLKHTTSCLARHAGILCLDQLTWSCSFLLGLLLPMQSLTAGGV